MKRLIQLHMLLLVFASVGGCAQTISGTLIDKKSRKPIGDAEVYLYTTTGNFMDENVQYWIYRTGEDGKYKFKPEKYYGTPQYVFGVADKYYPNYMLEGKILALKRVPKDTLTLKKGSIVFYKEKPNKGFDFSAGEQTETSKADIKPSNFVPHGMNQKAIIEANGNGGFRKLTNKHESITHDPAPQWSTFYNRNLAPANGYKKKIDWFKPDYNLWFVKTKEGHFAKLYSQYGEIPPDEKSMKIHFRYVYQPDGTRKLPPNYSTSFFKNKLYSGKRTYVNNKNKKPKNNETRSKEMAKKWVKYVSSENVKKYIQLFPPSVRDKRSREEWRRSLKFWKTQLKELKRDGFRGKWNFEETNKNSVSGPSDTKIIGKVSPVLTDGTFGEGIWIGKKEGNFYIVDLFKK